MFLLRMRTDAMTQVAYTLESLGMRTKVERMQYTASEENGAVGGASEITTSREWQGSRTASM